MADIIVISSSIVRPQNINQPSRTKIHLTPFDLQMLHSDYTQRGLLFNKPDTETHFISRLKTSLSPALEIYFPFAGRLVKVNNLEDNTVSYYIDCDNSSGAKFIHAESKSLSVSDILQPRSYVPDFMDHFFPFSYVKNCDGVSKPLLAIQVTEMKDGIFISYCTNHLVADGTSVWTFLNAWSKICSSGLVSNHQPLVLKGWFLDGINYPIHIPVSETERPPQPPSNELSSVPIRFFHFTKKNISDLKAKANSEVGSSDLEISSLQAVLAHIWRSVIRHSGLTLEGETHCIVAVDLRQRLNPPLEKECFGNMVYLPPAIATVGELLDRGLGWAALQINKLVRSQTNESCKAFAEDWAKNVKIPKPEVESRMAGNTIIVTSSPRFDVYNTDFGWGKVIAVRTGLRHGNFGKLRFFRGIQDGTIDVQATLWSDDLLVKLLADVEFLENVTVV